MDGTPKHSLSVAGVVVREDGRILVVQRRDNARWEPPGVVLELGETFEEGVRRHNVVALVFRCTPVSGETTVPDETRRVQWITDDEVRQRMAPACAARVIDATAGRRAASRAHDGVDLVAGRH